MVKKSSLIFLEEQEILSNTAQGRLVCLVPPLKDLLSESPDLHYYFDARVRILVTRGTSVCQLECSTLRATAKSTTARITLSQCTECTKVQYSLASELA